jgi:hypothetical protein
MDLVWLELDREQAAVETLEHAVELFDLQQNVTLALTIGLAAWRYFSERLRPGEKGRSARLALIEVLKRGLGEGFDATWVRQRAEELADDLQRLEMHRSPASTVRISRRTPVLVLFCAAVDCREATGRAHQKLDEWRRRQIERALRECLSAPEVAARASAIRAARGTLRKR